MGKKRWSTSVRVVGLALCLFGAQTGYSLSYLPSFFGMEPEEVLAEMGDVKLTVAEVQVLLKYEKSEVRREILAKPKVLDQIIQDEMLRKYILTRARARNWDKKPDVIFAMERARELRLFEDFVRSATRVEPNAVTDEEARKVYAANLSKFKLPDQVHLSQIYIAVEPGLDKSESKKRLALVKKVVAQARKKGADFSDLARRHSGHKSGVEKGGNLGWLMMNQLLPAMHSAILSMKVGEVSDPIKASGGYHVLKLHDRRSKLYRPYDQVKKELVNRLTQRKMQENRVRYLQDLKKRHPASIKKEGLSKLK